MANIQRTVLVVDDAAENIAVLSTILKERYKVRFATNGPQALILAAAEDKPSLILLDLVMPGMDGLETCRRLKSNPATADIPVIFVTARSEIEDEESGFQAGAVDYIIKPISAPILLARVRTQIALQEAIASAREADRAKSMFLATMSHEIRTPMNGITSMAELLRDSGLTPDQEEMIQIVQKSSATLLTIINDILDLSKIEAGRLDIESIAFSPTELFELVGEQLRAKADEKRLDFVIDLDAGFPAVVRGDSTRLTQVLLNLAGNAIKFTEQGTVTVRARIAAADAGGTGRLEVEVIDTGIGVTPEQQEKLFKPFSQADASTARRFSGTGLGLAISRRLCTLMGGTIGMESSAGAGSRFHFSVPIEIASAEPSRPLIAISDAAVCGIGFADAERAALRSILTAAGIHRVDWCDREAEIPARADVILARPGADLESTGDRPVVWIGPQQAVRDVSGVALAWPVGRNRVWQAIAAVLGRADWGPRMTAQTREIERWIAPDRSAAEAAAAIILIGDDDATNRVVIRRYLAQWGFHVDVTSDGAEALTAFDPRKHGLILTDLHMPNLDGIALTQRIRASSGVAAQVPIVGLTADALPDTRHRCLEAGMSGWLTKPIESAALRDCIESMLPQAVALRRLERAAAVPATSDAAPRVLGEVDRSVFDWERIAEPFGGWNDEARDFMSDFLNDLPAKLRPLSEAMAAGDRTGARFAAHVLKGAALSAGAIRLGKTAGELQHCLDTEDMARARDFEPALQQCTSELSRTLSMLLEERGSR